MSPPPAIVSTSARIRSKTAATSSSCRWSQRSVAIRPRVATAGADRPVTNTEAPASASSWAMPRPMPWVPPVTTATRPLNNVSGMLMGAAYPLSGWWVLEEWNGPPPRRPARLNDVFSAVRGQDRVGASRSAVQSTELDGTSITGGARSDPRRRPASSASRQRSCHHEGTTTNRNQPPCLEKTGAHGRACGVPIRE